MKIFTNSWVTRLSVAGLIFTCAFSLCGCDTSGPKPIIDPVRVDKAKQMREIFDKVDGDYSKLTPSDKDAFVKLTGLTPDLAKNWWVTMKYGLAGAPAGKGADGPK